MFNCSYIETDGWFIEGYLYGTVLDEEACAIVKSPLLIIITKRISSLCEKNTKVLIRTRWVKKRLT
jgi:hypothetical protein